MNNDIEKTLEASQQLFNKLKYLLSDPNEKTIFSIGGRGHYENPISDILAFYLDPNEEHGLGDLVLRSLLYAAKINDDLSGYDGISVEREARTDNGNRIDLLLHQEKEWGLVIENKIFHAAANPFEDYEKHVKEKHEDGKYWFILLSPKGDKTDRGDWHPAHYKDLIENIEQNLGPVIINQPFNKWHIFLRDFLVNLKQLSEDINMTDEEVLALKKDVKKIGKKFLKIDRQLENMKELKNNCLEKIIERGKFLLKDAIPTMEFKGYWYPRGSNPTSIYFQPQPETGTELRIDLVTAEIGWCLGFWFGTTKTGEVQRNKIVDGSGDFKITKVDPQENTVNDPYPKLEGALSDMVKLAKKIYS